MITKSHVNVVPMSAKSQTKSYIVFKLVYNFAQNYRRL